MILDLRFDGDMGMEMSQRINRIAEEIRSPFHQTIEDLSRGNELDIDWWVSSPPGRNTYVSPFFHYCCSIKLLQSLIAEKKRIDSIIVDSFALKKIIEKVYSGNPAPPVIYDSGNSLIQKYMQWIKRVFLIPLSFFYSHWRASKSFRKRKSVPQNAILIDTFVQDYSIDNEVYYPGLIEHLNEADRKNIFFVPTFYKIPPGSLDDVYEAVRASEKNYLLKEDFLKWKDYFFAWAYALRSRRLKIPSALFSGVNISPIAIEEIRSLADFGSIITALLNFRFSLRLKKRNVELKMAVNWFENQTVDKGWNAGFRKNYPEIEHIGYMGFPLPRHYLCVYPTQIEETSKVIPKEIRVIGKSLIDDVKEQAPGLKAGTAPAFRYRHVWERPEKSMDPGKFSVLVAFPILIDKAVEIMHRILEMYEILEDGDIQILLKTHPTCSKEDIIQHVNVRLPESFHFVDGKLEDRLAESRVLISAGSGVLMEAIAQRVPVIIIGSANGVTHHPVSKNIDSALWSIRFTSKELAESVEYYKNKNPDDLKREFELADKVRENYFEPVDEKGVRKFLKLE